MKRNFIVAGALFGGFAVALGAFGAHALKKILSEDQLNTFHTAVEYQFYHSLALLFTALIAEKIQNRLSIIGGYLFIAGILLFSGSLYLLTLVESMRWIGMITPIGGLCFIAGWTVLLVAGLSRK